MSFTGMGMAAWLASEDTAAHKCSSISRKGGWWCCSVTVQFLALKPEWALIVLKRKHSSWVLHTVWGTLVGDILTQAA